MERHDTYHTFWTQLVEKALQRQELRQIHQQMKASKSKWDHYLQARRDSILYQYNIWWEQETKACVYICDWSKRESTEWVDHGLGRLQDIDLKDWATVQEQMIDAMIKIAKERGLA